MINVSDLIKKYQKKLNKHIQAQFTGNLVLKLVICSIPQVPGGKVWILFVLVCSSIGLRCRQVFRSVVFP